MTFARNWAVFTSAFIFFKLGHSGFLAEEFVCGGPVKLEGAPWALLESHVWLAIKVSHSHIFSKTVHPNQNPTAPMFLATKPSKQDHVWMIFFLCVEQFFERGIIFFEVGIIVAAVWKNVPSYVMVWLSVTRVGHNIYALLGLGPGPLSCRMQCLKIWNMASVDA